MAITELTEDSHVSDIWCKHYLKIVTCICMLPHERLIEYLHECVGVPNKMLIECISAIINIQNRPYNVRYKVFNVLYFQVRAYKFKLGSL